MLGGQDLITPSSVKMLDSITRAEPITPSLEVMQDDQTPLDTSTLHTGMVLSARTLLVTTTLRMDPTPSVPTRPVLTIPQTGTTPSVPIPLVIVIPQMECLRSSTTRPAFTTQPMARALSLIILQDLATQLMERFHSIGTSQEDTILQMEYLRLCSIVLALTM